MELGEPDASGRRRPQAVEGSEFVIGIDMLVMDDGWFGNRNDDQRALGDWWVNEKKLKGGLSHLIQRVNDLGIQLAYGTSRR